MKLNKESFAYYLFRTNSMDLEGYCSDFIDRCYYEGNEEKGYSVGFNLGTRMYDDEKQFFI